MAHDPRSTRPYRHTLHRRTLLGAAFALPSPPPTESPDEHGDALIVALCQHVCELEVCMDFNNAAWDRAVRQLSTLPAQSLAGVRAKAGLLRAFLPIAPGERPADWISPDEQLLASLLDDLPGGLLGDAGQSEAET